MKTRRPAWAHSALPLLMVLAAGCSHDGIASHWSRHAVTIDGDQDDWQGTLKRTRDQDVAVGVMNDDIYLYVTLSSPNQRTMAQIMRGGFTVWFDPRGRQRKVLGIRYPLGAAALGVEDEGWRRAGRGQRPDPAGLLKSMRSTELFVEVSGPAKDDLAHVPLTSEGGIQVAIGWSAYGHFVYELRIPLEPGDSSPHAVGAAPGQTIAIGFEGGGMARQDRRRPSGGFSGGRGGGRGGMGQPGGGRSGFSGGGRGGAGRGQMGQPIHYWVRVTLAEEAPHPARSDFPNRPERPGVSG